jgi:hypothetical protein
MAFRLYKSIRILPGVRINLSRTGPSVSIGGRGASVNASRRGIRTTAGIPGSGFSWSKLFGFRK